MKVYKLHLSPKKCNFWQKLSPKKCNFCCQLKFNMLIFHCEGVYMERKIYKDLLKWKESPDRKPLLLQGARQVGKTYIVNLFGSKEYSNVVYCNFEQEQALKEFFDTLNPSSILSKIGLYKRKEIIPGQTLIIFDEIQACPEALTSLKYFCEEANEYHIIATGSLLGVSVNRQQFSFPVGKVEFLTMHPMDFEEFLLANGENWSIIVDEIYRCFEENTPLGTLFHNETLEMYRNYLYVGGMPEVVDIFVRTGSYEMVRVKQNEILNSYFDDMGKYNKATEIPKTRLVYKNISTQLAKENKKFQYKLLKPGARASAFEDAIEWLCLAGIANQLYRIDKVDLPLDANRSLSDFKFYMNDVGLCCASQNVLIEDILLDRNNSEFKGGLAENYVNNQLIINKFQAYYWTSKYDAEVDFVTRIGQDIIPIEVKSSDNTRSRSLNTYMSEFNPAYAIRISAKNFGFENNIKSVPLYAAFCLENK